MLFHPVIFHSVKICKLCCEVGDTLPFQTAESSHSVAGNVAEVARAHHLLIGRLTVRSLPANLLLSDASTGV